MLAFKKMRKRKVQQTVKNYNLYYVNVSDILFLVASEAQTNKLNETQTNVKQKA